MSLEESQIEAVATAPESENTANTETVVTDAPEAAEPRLFTQEELDAIVGKEKAKERRKWERDAQKQAADARQVPIAPPDPKQYQTQEAYNDALVAHKVDETIAQRDSQKQHNDAVSAYREREEDTRSKYPDYDEVAYGEGSRVTNAMASVIVMSDIGTEIMYHLGQNRDEARRIANLSPLLQAREIGKIEASLTTSPPVKKTSSAPEPIKPGGSRSSVQTYDTTDPRSIASTDTSDWIAKENKRRMKLAQG